MMAPIRLVAVAPPDEVYGTIHSLYIRQFLIQGILIFALILAACAVIYYEMRWSVELQREVDHATTNLRRSREQYKSVVEKPDLFSWWMRGPSAPTPPARLPARRGMRKGSELSQKTRAANFADTCMGRARSQGRAHQRTGLLVSTHFVPVFGEDGRTVDRILVMARDITERQRIEDQLYQTEKLASLGTLSAGVAHEINNPLGVILGFTEILLDRIPLDSKEHELLKTIERQGLNAKRIVEKLMTYARQPAKQEEFTDLNKDSEMVTSLLQNNLLPIKLN
jgi:signal transduction histidine kinase